MSCDEQANLCLVRSQTELAAKVLSLSHDRLTTHFMFLTLDVPTYLYLIYTAARLLNL